MPYTPAGKLTVPPLFKHCWIDGPASVAPELSAVTPGQMGTRPPGAGDGEGDGDGDGDGEGDGDGDGEGPGAGWGPVFHVGVWFAS
jgi:hypothetical protein